MYAQKSTGTLALCGIAAPVLYFLIVFLGGLLKPDYSHVAQAVSELIETGAQNKPLLDSLFIIYNVLIVLFSVGLHRGIGHGKDSKVAPVMLAAGGVLGIGLTLFFPCDPGCAVLTRAGSMHMITAFTMSLVMLFSMFAFWRRLEQDDDWKGYDQYSFVTFVIALLFTMISAILITGPYTGLVERVVIAIMLQWVFVMALKLRRISIPR